jgi:hypothetical protein
MKATAKEASFLKPVSSWSFKDFRLVYKAVSTADFMQHHLIVKVRG